LKEELGIIEGDVEIKEEFRLRGIISGSTQVLRGGILHLHGICTGEVRVDPGGIIYLHGITKNVLNNGGRVEVFGMITGTLTTLSGNTLIDPDAVIRNF